MAMEVMIMPPPPQPVSDFDSATVTPYISASSSPQRFNISPFYTAPTSPIHFSANISTAASSNYGDVDEILEDIDFAFDFTGQLEKSSLSADELFDGGKIKPLKTPPNFQNMPLDSPKSPRSPKNLIKEAFTSRQKKRDSSEQIVNEKKETEKGMSRDNGTRSLSILRVSDLLFDPDFDQEEELTKDSSSWYKKWRIKDLLLFRSASESRINEHDNVQKYAMFKKTEKDVNVKSMKFIKSKDSVGSSLGSSKRKTGTTKSAHEMHYTTNRAVSEEMKKRTYLPYKQGLLGCLKFRPSAHDHISRGIHSVGSLSRR